MNTYFLPPLIALGAFLFLAAKLVSADSVSTHIQISSNSGNNFASGTTTQIHTGTSSNSLSVRTVVNGVVVDDTKRVSSKPIRYANTISVPKPRTQVRVAASAAISAASIETEVKTAASSTAITQSAIISSSTPVRGQSGMLRSIISFVTGFTSYVFALFIR